MILTPRSLCLFAMAIAGLLLLPACAQGGNPDRTEMEKIVREYILANPEIIEEALVALTEREKQNEAIVVRAAIADNWDRLYSVATDYSIGPADAPVTVVEFFDYRCGFCKRSAHWAAGLPEAYDGQVRVVFKELPIFGGISDTAARAALAAGRQDKYLEMHLALMDIQSNNDLTEQKIDEIAGDLGLDVRRMRADMASGAISQQLAEMENLGRALRISGTPAFFIGDEYVAGADTRRVEQLIAAALGS
ncbi:MAG: DsbA family protein [Hyphomonas sp.]